MKKTNEQNVSKKLEYLVHSFVELIICPEVNEEIINRLDEFSTNIIECITELGRDEDIDYLSDELMTYIAERISECGAEEYAVNKLDLLISVYDDLN